MYEVKVCVKKNLQRMKENQRKPSLIVQSDSIRAKVFK